MYSDGIKKLYVSLIKIKNQSKNIILIELCKVQAYQV